MDWQKSKRLVGSFTVLEHSGDLSSQIEEGNATAHENQTTATSPFEEDIIHSELISDPAEDSSKEEVTLKCSEQMQQETDAEIAGFCGGLSASQCQRKNLCYFAKNLWIYLA